jgi:hypothetical protein
MPRGVAALLALIVSALVGWFVAIVCLRPPLNRPLHALAANSIVLIVVSAVYWLWAAFNLLYLHHPDAGVVSFLVAFHASYRTADMCVVQNRRPRDNNPVLHQRWIHPGAVGLVAMHYVYGLVSHPNASETFRAYLWAGAAFWALAGIRINWLFGEASVQDDLSALREHALETLCQSA